MRGPASSSIDQRAYGAAHFMLELDGHQPVGFVRSIAGGGVKAEVLTAARGGSRVVTSQLGRPRFEEVVLEVGLSMSAGFYAWIASFVAGQGQPRNGAIVSADFHLRERARRELHDVLISEVAMPQLDAANRSPCALKVTLAPSGISFAAGSGAELPAVLEQRHALWTANRFELAIDGLEAATRRTLKVEAFAIKQPVLEAWHGAWPSPLRVAGRVEIPTLAFHIPEVDAGPIVRELTARLLGPDPRRGRHTGQLSLLDAEGVALCAIDLGGIEIASIGPVRCDAASQEINQVRVEISVETMAFGYRSDAVDA